MSPSVAVLVHGGTLTSTMWDPVRTAMAAPSVAVDLPGRRYKPADLAEVTIGDWVTSVVADIEEAGLTDVVLVGHSSGGYVLPGVAAALAARAVPVLRGLGSSRPRCRRTANAPSTTCATTSGLWRATIER